MKLKNVLLTRANLFAAAVILAVSAQAVPFTYSGGDVLVCFRKSTGGTYDMVVDAGPVSTFTNLPYGQQIVITPTDYTGTQLAGVGTNNVSWAAFAYYKSGSNPNTLFMSNPWDETQSPAAAPQVYYRQNATGNGYTINYLTDISNAATNGTYNTGPNGSATVAFVPETATIAPYLSYVKALGPNDDFNGTFQADPEVTTGPTFTTDGIPFRADFDEMIPASGQPDGVTLGYFEFSTNGVMTYTSTYGSSPVVAATNVTIRRAGTTNTITFTTGASGTYTLLGTNVLGAPVATWPSIGQVPGNGGQQSIMDVTSGGSKFYSISAQ